ncbi:MAG TPA: HEAT repeat domain-containing protein [Candidatus Sulfotelmatobacter sp.]
MFDAGEADVYEYLDDIWWREVILMTSGIMNQPDSLINQILDAAQDLEFDHFSEIGTEFARVMTAMSCFRPASHRLTANTSRRLIEYLVRFLRHGNILQKVRCLRIVPQIQDPKILDEVKRLLRDKSKWVRETALSALAESAVMGSQFGGVLNERLVGMTRTEELLVQGLQDFPVLLHHRTTRWYVPLYFVFALTGIIRAAGAWLLFFIFLYWQFFWDRISAATLAWFSFLPIGGYFLARRLLKRRFATGYRFNISDSFNRWTVFTVLWTGLVYLVTSGVANIGKDTGTVGNIGIGLVNYALILVVMYFCWTRGLAFYVELRRREREKWFDLSSLRPDEPMESRTRQAQSLIEEARRQRLPHIREQLIDTINKLLPLDRPVLLELEAFTESELDVNVRTRAFQVYDKIELSIEREESARKTRGDNL